jgi:hypothetical protein
MLWTNSGTLGHSCEAYEIRATPQRPQKVPSPFCALRILGEVGAVAELPEVDVAVRVVELLAGPVAESARARRVFRRLEVCPRMCALAAVSFSTLSLV